MESEIKLEIEELEQRIAPMLVNILSPMVSGVIEAFPVTKNEVSVHIENPSVIEVVNIKRTTG